VFLVPFVAKTFDSVEREGVSDVAERYVVAKLSRETRAGLKTRAVG
jgi:hypothetical protein